MGIGPQLRLILRVGFMLLALIAYLPFHLVATARGNRSRWTRRYLKALAWAFGLRVRVRGHRLRRDVLIAANHLSWLDIIALGSATGGSFIAKSEIDGWPLVGWLARQAGAIFVAREARGEAHNQVDTVAEALANRRPALLFAEGTTAGEGRLLPFRPALFAAVSPPRDPRLRVQPVAIDYGKDQAIVAWPRRENFNANAGKLLRRAKPLTVTLTFLAPIDPAGRNRKEIAAEAHAAVAAALGASVAAVDPV
jgi:1-acyl-sn-glycerol-3-phosphate acyltransferase